MSGRRDPLWYWLNDPTDELAENERRLDRLDIEIDVLTRICHDETKARLEQLGIDTSNYRPMPHFREFELRSSHHLTADHDTEQLMIEATESKLDKLYREHFGDRQPATEGTASSGQRIIRRNIGQVLGVR